MSIPLLNESEDKMIFLACVILAVVCLVTATSASLWFCNCCSKRSKFSRGHGSQYGLSGTGWEFDDLHGSFTRNALTAQLSPTIRVSPGSSVCTTHEACPRLELVVLSPGGLNRSASYEVCSEGGFAASASVEVPGDVERGGGGGWLGYVKQRLARLRWKQPVSTVDAACAETSVDRELGHSSMDGMLRKFDSLVLSVQWSDLTAESADAESLAAFQPVDKQAAAAEDSVQRFKSREPSAKKLVMFSAAGSYPSLKSPDVFSFKSFGSQQSFYSIDGLEEQSFPSSTSDLFRSCSLDGIPQSGRRASCRSEMF